MYHYKTCITIFIDFAGKEIDVYSLFKLLYNSKGFITNSNMTSFFCIVNKRMSYLFGIISFAHAPVNVTDFHWQHKFCATFSANININYRLPIKIYYRICTLRHSRIEINHGSQNVF